VVHSSDPRLLQATSLAGPHAADILGSLLQVKPVHVVFEAKPDESVHRGRGPHNLIFHFWLFFAKTSKNEAGIDVRDRFGALFETTFEAPDEKDVGAVPQFCAVP
jgi:hypothetical protein